MKNTLVVLIAIALAAGMFACPSPDPEEAVRAAWEKGKEYIRTGRYDMVWTLHSQEYRQKAIEDFEKQKATVRGELAKSSDWIEEWVVRQFGVSSKVMLVLSPRELHARMLQTARDKALSLDIYGIVVEGGTAHLKIATNPTETPYNLRMILRDGRWLIHERDYRPK